MKDDSKNIDNETLLDEEGSKSPFKKSDGSVNKLAVGLSCSAIAIALLIGGYVVERNKHGGVGTVSDNPFNGMTDEEAREAVSNAFLTAINDAEGSDMSSDDMKKAINQLITDYMQSTNGFTSQQITALNQLIGDYLDSTTVYWSIDENKRNIDAIYKLIEDRYNANRAEIEGLKAELNALAEKLEKESADTKKALDGKAGKDGLDGVAVKSDLEDVKALIEKLEKYTKEQDDKLAKKDIELDELIKESNEKLDKFMSDLDALLRGVSGIDPYDSSKSYYLHQPCVANNKLYISLIDNNKRPLSDTSAWAETDVISLLNQLDNEIAKQYTIGFNKLMEILEEQKNTNTSVEGDITTINNNISEINADIDDIKKDVKKNSDAIDSNKADIEKNSDAIEEINRIIVTMNAKLSQRIDELEIKQSSDLQEVKNNLTGIIDANEKLSVEEREKLKLLIDSYAADSAANLSDLQSTLTDTITANKAAADADRDALQKSVSDLGAKSEADAKALKDQIDANKALSDAEKKEMKDIIDANRIASNKDMQSLQDKVNKNKELSDAERQAMQEIIDANKNAADADAKNLKAEIDANKNLSDAEKDKLKKLIDSNKTAAEKNVKDLKDIVDANKNLSDAEKAQLKSQIDANKTSSEASAKTLKDQIDANKALSDSEKKAMKDLIDANKDAATKNASDLKKQIDANKALSDAEKEALGKLIDANKDAATKSVKDLKDQVDANKALSDAEKAQLKNLIDENASTMGKNMKDLSNDLSDVIAKNKAAADAADEALLASVDALKDATATDIDVLRKAIQDEAAIRAELGEQLESADEQFRLDLLQEIKDRTEGDAAIRADLLKGQQELSAFFNAVFEDAKREHDLHLEEMRSADKELADAIAQLRISQSSSLSEVQKNLLKTIDDEKQFTAEEREKMASAIEKCDSDSKSSLNNLNQELTAIINSNADLDEAARAEMTKKFQALNDATAGDIAALSATLDTKLAELKAELNLAIENYKTETNNTINSMNDRWSTLSGIPYWTAGKTYNTTNFVLHGDYAYKSQVDGNASEPGKDQTKWLKVTAKDTFESMCNRITSVEDRLEDGGYEFEVGKQGNSIGYYVDGKFKPF